MLGGFSAKKASFCFFKRALIHSSFRAPNLAQIPSRIPNKSVILSSDVLRFRLNFA